MAEMIREGQMQALKLFHACLHFSRGSDGPAKMWRTILATILKTMLTTTSLLALQQRLGWTCKDVEDTNVDNNPDDNPDNNLNNNLNNNLENNFNNNMPACT